MQTAILQPHLTPISGLPAAFTHFMVVTDKLYTTITPLLYVVHPISCSYCTYILMEDHRPAD